MLHSFPFFSRVFGDLWDPKERYVLFRSFLKNGKEREERNVLLQRTEKNGKNVTFFCKERKRTERTLRSFAKNGKERKERSVLLQRTEKNARTFRSFAKRTGERYVLFSSVTFFFEIYIEIYIDIYRYI